MTVIVLLGTLAAAQGNSLENVKDAWRTSIREKTGGYFKKHETYVKGYIKACRNQERQDSVAGNVLGELFWETERQRVEAGEDPPASTEGVPDDCRDIRTKWADGMGGMRGAFEKTVAENVPALDDALEKLEFQLTEHESRKDELRELIWTRLTLSKIPEYAVLVALDKEDRFGYVVPGDVALASMGATELSAEKKKGGLIDGISQRRQSCGRCRIPGGLEVEFPVAFQIDRIRFHLFHGRRKRAFYRYRLKVSADGHTWQTIVDRSKSGQWRGWQDLSFPARPVKAIRFEGTHNSAPPKLVTITEMEAYCIGGTK